ncbi:flavin monoamine oxidase family protein [Filimonas effusa]|uniref:FAD-dependent oxidoreductase n=1 Tax=Filimonas effusa TaxID=2508721 RepID=A0A4Q1DC51_9BACT|nr:NAD(P)/FAD-dependent oxidoreductase [Filimonas effusa]RXK87084.1 FAD-dependent oxidoreductase [Filimonas effusa]
MHRREFIQLTTALTGASLLPLSCSTTRKIPGTIVGASAKTGHLIRDGRLMQSVPVSTEQTDILIIGAGISGLSAARSLHRQGHTDMVILEMESHAGGNASSGSNAINAYPWGAHYVPIANTNLAEYLAFLQENEVITGYTPAGLPIYNELYLCSDPQERLYINGSWQEGLVPSLGVGAEDRQQIDRFLQQMQLFREARGNDAKEAFAIPVDASSKDPHYTRFDTITMHQWMQEQQYTSDYLRWYIDYCTRDDFGTGISEVSAWAGIHYFACRKGKAGNAASQDVLTWPQGNGWLASRLSKDIQHCLRPHTMATRLIPGTDSVTVHYYDVTAGTLKAITAKTCIVAIPQLIAARLLPDSTDRLQLLHRHYQYSPWLVANITVKDLAERSGASPSWDNVLYNSPSLGYVDATQQQLQQLKPRRVLTYYRPMLTDGTVEERKKAQQRSHEQWVNMIIDDLRIVHPDIEKQTEQIDIMLWGHAMAQPRPQLIHGGIREQLQASLYNRVHFAHTDLAGVSIFEEAFYQGIEAAQKARQSLS